MTASTQTATLNPLVVGASSSLAMARGAEIFTGGARNQMLSLASCAARGLRAPEAPAVHAVKAFRADIGKTLTSITLLVKEHAEHVVTQRDLAADPNLYNAAIGYLDQKERGSGGATGPGKTTGAGSGNVSTGSTSWEIDGTVHGPNGAERAMRACADALGASNGQAGALMVMRARLVGPELKLNPDSVSPILLAKINGELVALRLKGHHHADEFRRQVQKMRDKVAANKGLSTTQAGGWLDPKNNN